jgi:pyruvate dehydrogenase E1 component
METKLNQEDLQDWQAAIEVLEQEKGHGYTAELLQYLKQNLRHHMHWNTPCVSYQINLEMIQKTSELIRWNAAQIVNQASHYGSELGGHISTYASCATLYDIGFAYFFRGSDQEPGDLVLYQGHASPGIYARSYLEGVISRTQIEYFRRESTGKGVSSYPHPWLMPNYWQFPTVSMGLGPLQGIYHARLLKYLYARELLEDKGRKVWVFCGDGEMDEVESIGALGVASREHLDNLIFVINCNLVRLDGPCRGNSSIIKELTQYFEGFGWDVVKVIWSQYWLELVEKDSTGQLKKDLMALIDGEIQHMYATEDGVKSWLLSQPYSGIVKDWKDEDFKKLVAGGHDPQLVANAYAKAVQSTKPCVVLVMSEKGHLLPQVASSNRSHNQKSLSELQLKDYLEHLPTLPQDVKLNDFYHPGDNDAVKFLHSTRESLGGFLPKRAESGPPLSVPKLTLFQPLLDGSTDREYSTTMAFVRFLSLLLRDKGIKDFVVPIIADEGRTLGMEGLFRQIGIYSSVGQKYQPHDAQQVSSYKESKTGQLLQEGINEAGAITSWLCAATSYSVNDLTLVPFYIYYSMFGFQRVGDEIWAAFDSRARGFLIGATAGRTTLGGEGLQHNDATSHLIASTIPSCKSYDPCYGYELAVILQYGMVEMYEQQKDVFYYITVMNENYAHPQMPIGIEDDILSGLYVIDDVDNPSVEILASGTLLLEARSAAKVLLDEGISVRVWSVTSWSEAARHADKSPNWLSSKMTGQQVFAVSDYVTSVPGLLREYIQQPFHTLGTDGHGLSDTREALREHFAVSKQAIVSKIKASMRE